MATTGIMVCSSSYSSPGDVATTGIGVCSSSYSSLGDVATTGIRYAHDDVALKRQILGKTFWLRCVCCVGRNFYSETCAYQVS